LADIATQAQTSRLTPPELAAWRGLLRAHAALVKALDAELEHDHGLLLTAYEVLLFLDGADGKRMRMFDLAESALLSRSGMTRLVDRLERDGLVERLTCEKDARGSYAVLTDAGADKLAAARVTHLAGVREHFLSRFTQDELKAFGSFWERVLPGTADSACDAGC
jgi:DNA-binding MarR family transcriptional regulator